MATLLITGSDGFIGKNLFVALKRLNKHTIRVFDTNNSLSELPAMLSDADFVYHLAGINRPTDESEFKKGNTDLTQFIANTLLTQKRDIPIVLTSSTQAASNNPYGISKKQAEDIVFSYAKKTKTQCYVYRLPNVFGKWCKPNYNSAVATFCYNISHGLDIKINDPSKELELVYIDDIVEEFINLIESKPVVAINSFKSIYRTFKTTVEELAKKLYSFKEIRKTQILPDMNDVFTKFLYSTYLSYLDSNDFAYSLEQHSDERGVLAEMLKSANFGQIFVSHTKPGITRGNHYHDTKIEKFCIISGLAIVRFKHILSGDIVSYKIKGDEFKIIDIPPGYTHSIENIGDQDLIVLFWANSIFDKNYPDTTYLEVLWNAKC